MNIKLANGMIVTPSQQLKIINECKSLSLFEEAEMLENGNFGEDEEVAGLVEEMKEEGEL